MVKLLSFFHATEDLGISKKNVGFPKTKIKLCSMHLISHFKRRSRIKN